MSSKWLDYFKRKRDKTMEELSDEVQRDLDEKMATLSSTLSSMSVYPTTAAAPSSWFSSVGATAAAPAPVYSGSYITAVGSGAGVMAGGGGGSFAGGFGTITFSPPKPTSIIALSNSGTEIVRLNIDGSVTWNDKVDVDAAAEAFGQAISIGAELSAGVTKRVKLEMRDSVFEDLIAIAKEKGSLTAEDLTYLLQASKIVEKLKGGRHDS
jgi:hypothetical protein